MNFFYAALILAALVAIKIGAVVIGIILGGATALMGLYFLIKLLRTKVPTND